MNVMLHQKMQPKKDDPEALPFDVEEVKWNPKPIGFYKDLESACQALLNRELQIQDAENLGELVGIIHKTKNDIQKAIADHAAAAEDEDPFDDVDDIIENPSGIMGFYDGVK